MAPAVRPRRRRRSARTATRSPTTTPQVLTLTLPAPPPPPPPGPPPPPPPPGPQPSDSPLALFASFKTSPNSLRVSKSARFKYSFKATPLRSGKISLKSTKKVKIGSRKGFLKVAAKAFTASSTGTVKVNLKLSSTSLKALKRAKQLRFAVTVKLGGKTFATKLTLKAPKRS